MGKAQWITNERLKEMKDSQSLIPPVLKGSGRDFRPPPTIESDFTRLLQHDVPHTNFTFELVRDWFAVSSEDYEKIFIRGQQTPIDWKSKIGNSDMYDNFKTDYQVTIHKGDYVVREDGVIFLLAWAVVQHPNNQATQSVECNDYLTFTRWHKEDVDDYGYAIPEEHDNVDEQGREIVVDNIPASHSEYSGRPDFELLQNTPGVNADHLITVYVQWNQKTKNLRIGDQFEIGASTYRAVMVYTAEVDINKEYGMLEILGKRVAGGGTDGN